MTEPGTLPPPAPLPDRVRRSVLRQAVSVGVAAGTYGLSFGALGVAAGLDLWQTCALSLLVFTGASQFAFVAVLAAGGSGATAVATATLLGVRNGLYGLQVTDWLQVRGIRRIAAAQLTIDESTAVGVAQDTEPARRLGFWATGLSVLVMWNASTFVGALLGNTLGDPRRFGLDGAAAAAFTALLWPRLRSAEGRLTAGLALVLALGVAPWVPAGIPVVVAALAAVGMGLRRTVAAR
ncbi:MAG: AzlC family ABC transporter permease [Dermatophilaceae bacterium]